MPLMVADAKADARAERVLLRVHDDRDGLGLPVQVILAYPLPFAMPGPTRWVSRRLT